MIFHSSNQEKTTNIQQLQNSKIIPITILKKSEQTICNYCNKNFSCYNSMNRHVQKCKVKESLQAENDRLKKELMEIKRRIYNQQRKDYKIKLLSN